MMPSFISIKKRATSRALSFIGDKEWTYPKSLKESLKVPPEMEDYINDWKLPVLELPKKWILKERNV